MTMVRIGPFHEGEVPEPLEWTFLDADGDPIDLTGYTASFHLDIRGARQTLPAGLSATPTDGTVTHVWLEDEIADGPLTCQFWVTNGTNTYASDRIKSYVYEAV